MKTRLIFTLVLVLVLLSGVLYANGIPAIGIDLYETIDNTPNGIATERPPGIPSGISVINDAWIILLEKNNGVQDESNWIDLVHQYYDTDPNNPTGPQIAFVRLFSDSESDPWPITYQDLGNLTHIFWNESPDGITNIADVYIIHSDGERSQVPEPSSILLAMTGLMGIGGFRLLRRK
jgi:hypothetical protein